MNRILLIVLFFVIIVIIALLFGKHLLWGGAVVGSFVASHPRDYESDTGFTGGDFTHDKKNAEIVQAAVDEASLYGVGAISDKVITLQDCAEALKSPKSLKSAKALKQKLKSDENAQTVAIARALVLAWLYKRAPNADMRIYLKEMLDVITVSNVDSLEIEKCAKVVKDVLADVGNDYKKTKTNDPIEVFLYNELKTIPGGLNAGVGTSSTSAESRLRDELVQEKRDSRRLLEELRQLRLDKNILDLKGFNSADSRAVSDCNNQRLILAAEVRNLKDTVADLQRNLDNCRSKPHASDAEVASLKDSLSRASRDLSDCHNRLRDSEGNVGALKVAYEECEREHAATRNMTSSGPIRGEPRIYEDAPRDNIETSFIPDNLIGI